MSEKYKILLKSILTGIVVGVAVALIVYIAVSVYTGSLGLDLYMTSVAEMIRAVLISFFGATAFFAGTTVVLGRSERAQQREWIEQNRRMAKDYNADIKGVNLAGLIDDTQGKEFCTIYGERITKGEDHGTMYMIFKTIMILCVFMTVSAGTVMFCMLAAMN